MAKFLKVIVTGFIEETVIDTEKNIFKYLKDLKQRQKDALGETIIKRYNRDQSRHAVYYEPFVVHPKQLDYPLSIKIQSIDNDEYF